MPQDQQNEGAGKERKQAPPVHRGPTGLQGPLPSDHLRLLIELLRPAGPELARRWLAALMVVPAEERAGVVEAVEARIVSEFGGATGGGGALGGPAGQEGPTPRTGPTGGPRVGPTGPRTLYTAVSAPVERDGYVERVETEYEVEAPDGQAARSSQRSPANGGARSGNQRA